MNNTYSPDDLLEFSERMGCGIEYARRDLDEMDPGLRKRLLFALHNKILDGELLRDPIEMDPVFRKLIEAAAVSAESNVKYKGMGLCHMIWTEQARILKTEHQIDWYSPAEMNPWVMMD